MQNEINIRLIVKYWEDELAFVEKTILELERSVFSYKDMNNNLNDNLLVSQIMSDTDVNNGLSTSYQYNLEIYKDRKKQIQKTLEIIKTILGNV